MLLPPKDPTVTMADGGAGTNASWSEVDSEWEEEARDGSPSREEDDMV